MDQAQAKVLPATLAVNRNPVLGAKSVLTASQKAQFDRDGFIIVRNLLDQVRLQTKLPTSSLIHKFQHTLS